MIHSKETIARIQELLTISGIPKGDIHEEMVDHYLSDIESQVALGINPQVAIRSTFQKIAKIDLKDLRKEKTSNQALAVVSIILLSVACYAYQFYFYPDIEQPLEIIAETKPASEPVGWPLNQSISSISSKFGMRKHPVLKTLRHHNGIDIKAKIGTPVLATGTAVVKKIGFNKNAGKFVILKHNSRYSTVYYHLSSIDVLQDESVTQGCVIGKVGNTGKSTAPHLHYEIMDSGTHIDPLECTRA